ncbi:MFS transporter [Lentzea nigeriaca]|uniref:MFS transporter n=1 Tax=Lentzea nigeriaca TaxID=1128665 RepID=UPI00195901C5|nr:MFS transporter [Lentzea nigeriaca]MBM7856386.1 MFS family permease [Lentzea nigeriaca]
MTSFTERLALPSFRGHGGLVAALAVDSIGTGLFLPFGVVYFLYTTSLPLPVIGAGLTAARLLALPASIVAGPLIDRFGARTVLAAGNLVSCFAFAGYLLVSNTWQLVLAAFLASVGQTTFWTASRALVGAAIQPDQRSSWFALQTMTRNAGYGLGGLIGAAAVGSGSRWVYLAFAAANALSFLLAALLVLRWKMPAVATASTGAPPERSGYRQLFRDRALLLVTLVNLAFVMCANVLTVLLVVYVTTVLHQPAWLGGALFTVNTIMVSTLQTITTRSVRKVSHAGVLRAAALCWAASFVLLWGLTALSGLVVIIGLFVAIVVFTIAEMLQDPIINTLVVDIAPPHLTGRYVAAYQLSWSAGNAVAPFLLTALLAQGVAPSWIVMVTVCLLAVVTIGRIRPARSVTEPAS